MSFQHSWRPFSAFTLIALLLLALASQPSFCAARTNVPANQSAKITFKRVFPGSSPELIEIVIREDSNAATYEIRQLDDDPGTLPFEVSDALRTKIFGLAAELHHFEGLDLDVHRKIANL